MEKDKSEDHSYFLTTDHIGFSLWKDTDFPLARSLWGDPRVSKFMCRTGIFTDDDIKTRLETEIHNYKTYGIQYYPIFSLSDNDFVGCCGYCPHDLENNVFELGCHLRPEYWGRSFGYEACLAAMEYGFKTKHLGTFLVRHHPQNIRSRTMITRLGCKQDGYTTYPPTGLQHPSYLVTQEYYDKIIRHHLPGQVTVIHS